MKLINSDEGKENTETELENVAVPPLETSHHWPALQMDVEYLQSFLEDMDTSQDQKLELIEMVWNIVGMFADLGFDIEPTQTAMNTAHKNAKNSALADFTKATEPQHKIRAAVTVEPIRHKEIIEKGEVV